MSTFANKSSFLTTNGENSKLAVRLDLAEIRWKNRTKMSHI